MLRLTTGIQASASAGLKGALQELSGAFPKHGRPSPWNRLFGREIAAALRLRASPEDVARLDRRHSRRPRAYEL